MWYFRINYNFIHTFFQITTDMRKQKFFSENNNNITGFLNLETNKNL